MHKDIFLTCSKIFFLHEGNQLNPLVTSLSHALTFFQMLRHIFHMLKGISFTCSVTFSPAQKSFVYAQIFFTCSKIFFSHADRHFSCAQTSCFICSNILFHVLKNMFCTCTKIHFCMHKGFFFHMLRHIFHT